LSDLIHVSRWLLQREGKKEKKEEPIKYLALSLGKKEWDRKLNSFFLRKEEKRGERGRAESSHKKNEGKKKQRERQFVPRRE